MPQQLLISDANILIDMDVGGLIDAMFALEYEFTTPNILYEQELAQYHPYLLAKGLRLMELAPESIDRASELERQYNGVSSYDLAALSLAEQVTAPLLSGDRKLRQVCLEEDIEVHGTIWLVEQILIAGTASVSEIEVAYNRMEEDGSRLPWDEVDKQLKQFRKKK